MNLRPLVACFAASSMTAFALAPATRIVAVRIDAGGIALVGTASRDRAFRGPAVPGAVAALPAGGPVVVEFVLPGPSGERFVRREVVRGLCLEHPPGTPPHVTGDTIRVHRDSLTVELPQLPGHDRLEVAWYAPGAAGPERRVLGTVALDAAPAETALLGSVHWPEEYGDPQRTTVWGSEAEAERRVNVVLVPDGYTYAQKALMVQHAQNVVTWFRGKTPFAEHDALVNYILVHAFSTQDGTDQCDCGVLRDTAMNTRFPDDGYPCQDSGNRCLYYGWGCDPRNWTDANIAAAELRAPARDATLVMVNTARYGGCGGARAVFAAANGAAAEIAVHELGHSLAGLADEYESSPSCGTAAGEINTSTNAKEGAWPEWIADLGAPREGGEYYARCIYRPEGDCEMRSLDRPFCHVCNQHWALTLFGHWRVAPTAPITAGSPESPVTAQAGQAVPFALATRLGSGAVTNAITWTMTGPGYPGPTTVATGVTEYAHRFVPAGDYTLTAEVVADTNFVKPERTGANRDTWSWSVHATPVAEVSGSAERALRVEKSTTPGRLRLTFENTLAQRYNVYVSKGAGTHPFRVGDPSLGKKDCAVAVTGSGPLLEVPDYDADAGLTGPRAALFLLVSADNGPGTEGPLGVDSAGTGRTADARCAP